ncbi:MAG: phospholipase D-like domain-containing protein [bacterium]
MNIRSSIPILIAAILLSAADCNAAPAPAVNLAVLPEDGATQIIKIISEASSGIDFVAHRFEEGPIADALAAAAARGVRVRVMLDKGSENGADTNASVERRLKAAHVFTSWTNPKFISTMARAIIADKSKALVLTFDPVQENFSGARGFAVLIRDPIDVSDLSWTYEADWSRVLVKRKQSSLAWEPDGAKAKLFDIIHGATASIDIYADDVKDPEIEESLAQAVKRGVIVRLLAGSSAVCSSAGLTRLTMDGVTVRCMPKLTLAARAIIADDGRGSHLAMLGISRLESKRSSQTRGLGVVVSDEKRLGRLRETFLRDWNGAK